MERPDEFEKRSVAAILVDGINENKVQKGEDRYIFCHTRPVQGMTPQSIWRGDQNATGKGPSKTTS